MQTPNSAAPVLVADIGGTNARFGLVDVTGSQALIDDSSRRYRAANFASFHDAMRHYLVETGVRPVSAVIAAAGPRVDDEVRLTNIPWRISRAALEFEFGLTSATLINDFAAMGLCVPLLRPGDIVDIGVPRASITAHSNRTFAIVGPGTGLGVGALLVRDGRITALETEGGHMSFAPRDGEEIEILHRLTARFGRVSNERLLCGSGLVNLYGVLCEIDGSTPLASSPEEIMQRVESDLTCRRAVEKFRELLGAVAGDLVLAFGAWDGVYLTGGLPPELAPWLQQGGFRHRFEDKGRFSEAMKRVPTTVVLRADAGLLGAAACALIEAGRTDSLLSR
ncbi:MAG: glucokinase [Rhodanobacteraceae bacterium]